jgi:hypothetical protein
MKQVASSPLHRNLETIVDACDAVGYPKGVARSALERLCQRAERAGRGFDPTQLAIRLGAIIGYHTKQKPEPLRYGKGPKETLKPQDLQRMARRVEELIKFVNELNRTPLAAHLRHSGVLPTDSIVGLPSGARRLSLLAPILELPELAGMYNSLDAPMMDRLLADLCSYVKRTTGKPHDKELVAVLEPFGIAHTENAEQLKEWRSRRKNAAPAYQRRPRRKKTTAPRQRRPTS